MIQKNVRSYLDLKNWVWWSLFTRARTLIDSSSGEKDKKKTEEALQGLKSQLDQEKSNVKKKLMMRELNYKTN